MADNQDFQGNINSPVVGLNMDAASNQLKPGMLTYALNAQVEGVDGNGVTYQNEQGSDLCVTLPAGYKVVGVKNIPQLRRVVYFITNPSTGDSQIGYSDNDDCVYNVLISDVGNDCKFGFSIDYPIRKSVVKSTNCSTQIYWTDGLNPRRYIDFDSLPWKEQLNPNNDFAPIQLVGQLDCNKLNVQPNFSVPRITPTTMAIGGNLQMGTYQFAIQYANILGDGYTGYYNVTNPLGIFENRLSEDFNGSTGKAVKVEIDGLDTTGLFEAYNLAVIKTVNNITSVELVGTYPIAARDAEHTYTGESQQQIRLTIADIFERFPYYDIAEDVFEVDNVIGWDILKADERLNYQEIWTRVKLMWETYKVPYNKFEAYNNGINTSQYRGYFRDEVYAFEGVFILKNGKVTDRFPIPGRVATPFDREIINNADAQGVIENPCSRPGPKERWEVYNTGSVTGTSTSYDPNDDCYVGPYQYGQMAYWESDRRYPNNPIIWGSLAGQKIRHHKFPDIAISPIHDNGSGQSYEHDIYPMGVKIDMQSLYDAIQASGLTQAQKDEIQGFKIVRANRKTHESVIAKGLMNNVGSTTYLDQRGQNGETLFYANYPYNDLRPDPFYANRFLQRAGLNFLNDPSIPMGFNPQYSMNGFGGSQSSRFVFHSPDTHFYQPSINNGGNYLKIESIEYGNSYGHFVKVKKNAEYKFLTRKTVYAAAGLGIASGLTIAAGTYGWPTFSMAPVAGTYNAATELFEKIAPFTNFGYAYHSIGLYGNTYAVPNNGNKIRSINFNKYVIDGKNSIEGGNQLNNIRRESSVYININGSLPYPHNYSSSIPQDTSRFNLAQVGGLPETIRQRPISSYYGAIKREIPDQYGDIRSYEVVDTGFYSKLYNPDGTRLQGVPTVFGGDIYINRFAWKQKQSIFTDTSVGEPNGTDIQYNEMGTLNYPMFWMSTKPARFDIDIEQQVDALANQLFNASLLSIVANILTGGAVGSIVAMNLVRKLFSEIYDKIGIKNVNFDQASTVGITEQGLMYLFVYGIPYFFVESGVNVDYRQATNDREGNFFPNVSGDIPDDWLQEINVPIIHDNTYFYNQTYSKQNKESYYSALRPDYDPTEKCYTFYPNRAIWSDKSNLEETKNNWLVYRPAAYHDFSKSFGKLTSIDRLEHNQMLVRYENASQLHNALTTVDVNAGPAAYLGNNKLFSSPPLDLYTTDTGHAGSQHKFMLHTEFGHVFVDAKRGQVILMRGNQAKNLADEGMSAWLTENLPFRILDDFPDYPIDNNFNGIGLHGVYDAAYKRIIITKNDHSLVDKTVRASGGEFYRETTQVVQSIVPRKDGTPDVIVIRDKVPPREPEFCNKSWTLSYSFITNSWVSFHSYQPNYYIAHPSYFQSGIQDKGVWNHNKSYSKYNHFYGTQYPYIIEYPFAYRLNDEILQNVKEFATVRKYFDFTTFVEPDETIFFNKSIIWNGQQCTGLLNLVPKPKNNLSQYGVYPIYNTDSKSVLLTKSDNWYNYNMFWDIVKDKSVPIFDTTCNMNKEDKELNQSNMDYTNRDFRKAQIRAKDARVRHILDNRNDVRMINKFIIAPTQPSYK